MTVREKIYNYIVKYTKDNLFPPSIREIVAALNFKSTSSVYAHLKDLELLGLVELPCRGGSRCIKLTGYKLVKEK